MISLDVTSFGAVGDGVSDDTASFELAIDMIRNHGGGRLVVTPAHYRLRPINLTSHFVLYLRDGAKMTAIAERWPVIPPLPSYGQGRDHPGPRYTSFLHGEGLTNVTIIGDGPHSVIDGDGQIWWDRHGNGTETITRGHLIEFMQSEKIAMYNLTLRNSPFWTNHFYDCDDVHVRNVHVRNPEHSPNTDGWDPDSSRNVLIEDSSYVGGDDCAAIKSGWDCAGIDFGKPTVNITIRNVSCHGTFSGIAIGSEMSGGIENVTIENVTFTQANKPVNIKVGNTRGGYVKNIVYQDLIVEGPIDQAIHIDAFHYYNNPNPNCPKDWKPPEMVRVSDVFIARINGTGANISGKEVFHFAGLPNSSLENIHLEDIVFAKPLHALSWNCTNMVNATVKNGSVLPWPPCPEFQIVDDLATSSKFNTSYHSSIAFFSFLVLFLAWQFRIRRCFKNYTKTYNALRK